MNLISEDYLMHHGVKGMKWGVRHDPDRTSRAFRKLQNFDEGYASGEYKGKKAEKTRNKLIKKANTLYKKDEKKQVKSAIEEQNKTLKKYKKALAKYERTKTTYRTQNGYIKIGNTKAKKILDKADKEYRDSVHRADKITAGKKYMNMYDFKRDRYFLGDRKSINNGESLLTQTKKNTYRW